MNKKGFTLIELMIVVMIIGILAAIAVPKIQRVLACGGKKKHSTACKKLIAEQEAVAEQSAYNPPIQNETITVNGVIYRRSN